VFSSDQPARLYDVTSQSVSLLLISDILRNSSQASSWQIMMSGMNVAKEELQSQDKGKE